MIEQPKPLSLTRPCELLGLSRAALYYRPAEVSVEELELMAVEFPSSLVLVELSRAKSTNGRKRNERNYS